MAKATNPGNSNDTRVIVEIRIPQLENLSSLASNGPSLRTVQPLLDSAPLEVGKKEAEISLQPSADIQLVQLDVNAVTIAANEPITGGNAFTKKGMVFPLRPISFYVDITGAAGTVISTKLVLDGKEEYKADIQIQASGRLTFLKKLP